MRVAIIGSGIAGLATAHLLYRDQAIEEIFGISDT
jgi:glycine/D-amino acid oxidase-like deaminating enzyme